MFTDLTSDVLNLWPSSKYPRSLCESSAQTLSCEHQDQESQWPNVCDAQSQVSHIESNAESAYNVDALNSFLRRVLPTMLQQLTANCKSQAFQHYTLMEHTLYTANKKLHALPNPDQMYSSAVAWNCSGSILAVGYGHGSHEKWCGHSSSVGLWNLARSQVDSKKPHRLVETVGCVTAISFHPHIPSILALGKVDGEVLVVDCTSEENLSSSSLGFSGAHQEAITGLHWVRRDSSTTSFQLISCSLDGKILVWDWTGHGQLEAAEGYVLLAEEKLSIKSRRLGSCIGVTCFSFNMEDESLFVVATEGGAIFQCSRQAATRSLDLKLPLAMAFERHSGYVHDIRFCPAARNLFATVASDGELHLYSLLQVQPILSVHCSNHELSCIQWSPSCPGVLAVGGLEGRISLYNLRNSSEPVEFLKAEGPVLDLQFGPTSPHLLATGGISEAQVWHLRFEFNLTLSNNEIKFFSNIFNI